MLNNGQHIGRYRILSPLGVGGMGEVFLAEDIKLERKVALKILPVDFAQDSERMYRFEREAKSTSALNHPNIITLHEIGETDNTHFIVTEYIEGETLRQRLETDKLAVFEILDFAFQIASALQAAHSVNIIHRDIKPENIMIRPDGLVKILDFGIAKLTEKKAESIDEEAATAIQSRTVAGMIIGTAAYMSPEQAQGKVIDARSDLFSFGVVLYEMLAGRQPFTGDHAMDVIGRILHKEPTSLNQLVAEIPDELERIISKALCKDCQERYQTAKDLLVDLKELKEELDFQTKLKRAAQTSKETEARTQIIKAVTGESSRTTSETTYANSIAVLPFSNISADAENEYFCDGLAEELLNALAKIEDLKVAARTSAFSFKNKNTEASQIGKALNVKTVLEGSVRRSGNKLRITVQLINVADGFHLWSERYDREMRDIFDVQDEITLAVIDALKLKLFGDEKAELLKRGTENAEAYQLYLKGRFFSNKFTVEGIEKAIELYEQVIAIDSEYAMAYVGISDAYFFLGIPDATTGILSPQESLPKALAAAEKALEIDSSLGDAWAALAHVKEKSYDVQGAKEAYRKSFESSVYDPNWHFYYGMFLSALGEHEKAIAEIRRGQELDPLSAPCAACMGYVLHNARRYDDAIRELKKALELAIAFPLTHQLLGMSYVQERDYVQAIKAFHTACDYSHRSIVTVASLTHAYAVSGNRSEAEKLLGELLDLSQRKYVSPYSIAKIYVGLNEKEKALEFLERAWSEKNVEMVFINVAPVFDPLRGDSRFQNLIRRIGLPTNETNQTDESLEAQTVRLSSGEMKSEQSDDFEAQNTNVKLNFEQTVNPKSAHPNPKSKWRLFGLLILILTVSGFFAYRYLTPNSKQIESIAVMPFTNESGNQDIEYLSDGMTETLINSLSQLLNLNVKARSSVFRYKGKDTNPNTIGKELNVQVILNGRVVQRGEQLILSLELIDAQTENVLWGNKYERKSSELIALQSEVARDVSGKLKSKLSGADAQKLSKTYTTDPEAYRLYLQGRFYWNKRAGREFNKAEGFFRQAVEKDPNFALGYVGLADIDEDRDRPKKKEYILRALALDDQLAEAHASLGYQYMLDYDWAASERQLKRAMELNPNYPQANGWNGARLMMLGRYDESLVSLKRAMEIDPTSAGINFYYGVLLFVSGKPDESIKQFKKLAEMEPTLPWAHAWLSQIYRQQGNYTAAVEERAVSLEIDDKADDAKLVRESFAKDGWNGFLREMIRQNNVNPGASRGLPAIFLAQLGEKEKAIAELIEAAKEGDFWLFRIKFDPAFDSLRGDARFQRLLKKFEPPSQ